MLTSTTSTSEVAARDPLTCRPPWYQLTSGYEAAANDHTFDCLFLPLAGHKAFQATVLFEHHHNNPHMRTALLAMKQRTQEADARPAEGPGSKARARNRWQVRQQ
jgi:hypothetical protein